MPEVAPSPTVPLWLARWGLREHPRHEVRVYLTREGEPAGAICLECQEGILGDDFELRPATRAAS